MIPAARHNESSGWLLLPARHIRCGLGVDAHVDVRVIVLSHVGEDDVVYPLMQADEVVYALPVKSDCQVHVPVTDKVVLVPVAPVESNSPGQQLATWLPGCPKKPGDLTL